MRKLPVAAAVSAALHLATIGWVATRTTAKSLQLPGVTVDLVPITVEPPVLAVTLLDDHTVSAIPAATFAVSHGTAGTPRQTAAIVAERSTTPPKVETAPAKTELMSMRRPDMRRGPSTDFVEHFLESSRPLAPKDLPSGQITDDIARSKGRLDDPRWIANATPDEVGAERARLAQHREDRASAELRPTKNGHHEAEHAAFHVDVAPDGTARLTDTANVQLDLRHARISFDITDALMRSHHQDPYASYKLKVLDETRDERARIGMRYRRDQLAHSPQLVQKNIAALWARTRDLAARKHGLFELWDDCAETGDAEVAEGGRAARAFVVGFIRSKLAGPDAYTADELAQLNAHRQSTATFAPYD